MYTYFQSIIDYAPQHLWVAVMLALLLSAGEALFVIGMFVPASIVLIGLGGLIGLGKLAFWPIFFATAVGAILGDAISYWIGRHYKQHLYEVWPFSRYQDTLHKGEAYFARHGGKSLIIGRFIPGIKSVVPGIVGMMGMKPLKFFVLNVISSVAWAITHLLPAMSAGWFVIVLANISKRLAITFSLTLILSVLLIWLVNRVIRIGSSYLPRWQLKLENWLEQKPARKTGLLGRAILAEHASFRQSAILYLLLALALNGLTVILTNVMFKLGLGGFDQALSQSLQGLRTAWTDVPMLAATLSGDATVMIGVIIAMSGVLIWKRQYRLLAGVAVTFLVTSLFVFGLKGLMQVPRPMSGLYDGVNAYSFPSGHTGFSTILVGLMIWFTFKGWQGQKRNLTVLLLLLLTTLVALSRIYLGAHWPSDVLGSLFFGALLTVVFALVFKQASVSSALTFKVLSTTGLVFILLSSGYVASSWQASLKKYTPQALAPLALTKPWFQGGWNELPTHRQDISGEQEEPYLLQWQGSLSDLQSRLTDWVPALNWSLTSLNNFARGDTSGDQLPVLPKLRAGQVQAVSLIQLSKQGRFVLLLYPQTVAEPNGDVKTIWLGMITHEDLYHPFAQLSLSMSDEASCIAPPWPVLPNTVATGIIPNAGSDPAGCGGQTIIAGSALQ